MQRFDFITFASLVKLTLAFYITNDMKYFWEKLIIPCQATCTLTRCQVMRSTGGSFELHSANNYEEVWNCVTLRKLPLKFNSSTEATTSPPLKSQKSRSNVFNPKRHILHLYTPYKGCECAIWKLYGQRFFEILSGNVHLDGPMAGRSDTCMAMSLVLRRVRGIKKKNCKRFEKTHHWIKVNQRKLLLISIPFILK